MRPVFTVDGKSYLVSVPRGGLKRQGRVLDGDKAGRLQSGDMERDVVGTYYNYVMALDTEGMEVEAYDALYEVLSSPEEFHTITVPYGQKTLTFQAYVANVDDELIQMLPDGRNLWGKLSFTFTSKAPSRRP
ncbi:hypothetical protein H7U37_07990 [Pseudoflavonifractor phocaeensis]|uniref:hypothetical protein n=1 Tax=Pseudoflavonifractor phocaeensis TaxID=1870988 RepID=UPI00195F14E9|nr:hypothetical protein [Pseudoflavonifractor phocaeensis]MBM6938461.1 hypothetical protein [Pseudoflavonifractor phocaeensis]